jgi:hypothetical protein
MTKKLSGLLLVGLFSIPLLNAGTACSVTATPTTVTATANGQQATFSGGTFTCTLPTIPISDTFTEADFSVDNSYSLGTSGQTNTLDFTYSVSGFGTGGTTGLTTSLSGPGTNGSSGQNPTVGGVVAQAPGSACTSTDFADVDCVAAAPGSLSSGGTFTVTGTSTWSLTGDQGNLQNGGTDQFSVFLNFSYAPIVSTPEPASLLLIGGGLLAFGMVSRRKKNV